MQKEEAPAAPRQFVNLSAAIPLQTAELAFVFPGTDRPCGWTVLLAGPAHPQTVALNSEISRENIDREHAMEFAQANGTRWKPEEETVEARRRRNVTRTCRRIVSWSPDPAFQHINNGMAIPFTLDAAVDLFLRPELGGFLLQLTNRLMSERAFMQPSEKV